jgi:hypothetical protein
MFLVFAVGNDLICPIKEECIQPIGKLRCIFLSFLFEIDSLGIKAIVVIILSDDQRIVSKGFLSISVNCKIL